MKLIDRAFEVVKSEGPNFELIAELGCELEQITASNYKLDSENRNIRRSYKRLKKWFTRQFKYYKAHRDELLQKQNAESGMGNIIQSKRFTNIQKTRTLSKSKTHSIRIEISKKTQLEQHNTL